MKWQSAIVNKAMAKAAGVASNSGENKRLAQNSKISSGEICKLAASEQISWRNQAAWQPAIA